MMYDIVNVQVTAMLEEDLFRYGKTPEEGNFLRPVPGASPDADFPLLFCNAFDVVFAEDKAD